MTTGARKDLFETGSGIPVASLYTAEDLEGHDARRDEGVPGQPPFTRGIQPTMYRGRLWSIRQYAGFGTATDANARFRYLLAQGQPGLSVAFDLPTQMGLDSDDPRSAGEVGQVGVAIDSVRDMEDLFAGIQLSDVSTSMTINAPAPVLVAMYVVAAERQGVDSASIMGTVQNDVLKEYIARGTFIYPPRPSLRLAADLIAWCTVNTPKFNPISLSGYHIREAGSTAVLFGLDRLDDVHKVCLHAVTPNAVEALAERFGARDPRSLMLRTHTQTGGSTLTAQQPENNIVRAAIEALAAVLGGVQSLALSCYDEALSIPTEKAQRIAVRTQQIIADETGVTNTVDPLAGSYFVEWLTDELERRAEALLAEVDARGGAVACIESGWMQELIQDEAYRTERSIAAGDKVIVGVNRHTETEEAGAPLLFRPDERVMADQALRLAGHRSRRDAASVEASLLAIREAAASDASLMPRILDAVRAEATLGEISGALRIVFGEYHPPATI